MSIQTIAVPDIGEYKNVEIIEVLVKVGDILKKEASVMTLETDKATMEVPCPAAGKVAKLLIKVGDKVSQGSPMIELETELGAAESVPKPVVASPTSPAAPAPVVAAPAVAQSVMVASKSESSLGGYASPAIRRLAKALGVEVSEIPGSGRKGRITQEDVEKFVKSRLEMGGGSGNNISAGLNLLADPVVDFAKFGEIEEQPLSRIKKISGANLHRNWVKIPHITFFEDADISELEEFRSYKKTEAEKKGVKLTPVPFIVKAVAKALEAYPEINASLSSNGDKLILKKYVHIGVAVDTPNGLVVPVIRDANKKGIYEIAKDLTALSLKAREGKLTAADMQGGCFTISSLGGIGTQYFAPIVNMPEVGILGVSKAQTKPIWDGQSFIPKLMLPLALSVDHRVIDGAYAAKFLVMVAQCLSDLKEIIL